MKKLSQQATAETWTCDVVPREGRLLDVRAIERTVRGVGAQFSVRGVEAVVIGQLLRREGKVVVRLRRTGEVLRLARLTRKVQWDPEASQDQPITAAEGAAYERLLAEWGGKDRPLRLVGPVIAPEDGAEQSIEVREYSWLR